MTINSENHNFVQHLIDLMRRAAIRVSSLAAQLAHYAHQLNDWMDDTVGEGSLMQILDAILAMVQRHAPHPILGLIVGEIRAFLRDGGGQWATA